MNYRMQIHPEIASIPEQDWNSLVLSSNTGVLHPGLRHEYLAAMESSQSVQPEKGWAPLHLGLYSESDELLGVIPLYLKSHSYGEYVFDWAWAQAYERHGVPYFPKLLCAIPFTPIQGPKLLAKTAENRELLRSALAQFLNQCQGPESVIGQSVSSFHALFLSEADQSLLLDDPKASEAFMPRKVVQFHWQNKHAETGQPYESFDHYLQSLSQKKRKNIRAERRKVSEAGVNIRGYKGSEIDSSTLEFFYQCYVQTYAEHFSTPYLTLDFFKALVRDMPESVWLTMAFLDEKPVASSFFIYSQERLYGRYWGATARIACLHFELCYYQAIEFAIAEGIQWFEGGAQGEHKMARGLNPCTMRSAHWVHDPSFREPIARYLEREDAHLTAYVGELEEHQAFKRLQEDQPSL